MTVSNIPSDWTAPVNHTLTTTGTGTGHATIDSNCFTADAFNLSLDTYDVCDDQGSGYHADGNRYNLSLRASIDSHSDSGETFTVTLTDSSTPVNTASFTMTINDPPVRIGVTLPEQEGVSRVGGKQPHEESTGSVAFDLSADEPLANNLTVCVRVSEQGGSRVAAGDKSIQTATLLASGVSNGSGTYTVNWTDTAADDPDSSIIVRVVAPEEAGCSATDGSYAVSADDPSDQILIQDDEDTTVSLTSTDMTMTEGDASDTATLTVALSRQLYAGETIGVPIALASTTGARLPGSVDGGSTANHDFTVAAAAGSGHSGVTLAADAPAATPRLVFTGHDSNTVQTATVTLTPVANRDDGDAAHETITATLTSLGLLDTTVSGVAAHGTNNAATLTLADDEAAPPPVTCSAQNPIFNDTSLRILETGETTYCVRLTTAPSGGDTTVTIGRIGGGATVSPASLTFTSSNYQTPQQVTVTGMDEPGSHRNRTTELTHTASGGGYLSQNLGRVNVQVDDAPEVEAFWYIKGGAGGVRIRRPHTITSTRGLTAWQNAAPGDRISYAVRLSNRPAPGGTVTVTATVPSDKRNLVGLSLTEGGEPENSVRVEFKDRSPGAGTGCSNWFGHQPHQYFDSHDHTRTVSGRQPSESYDGTPDTPWECWRMIYVVRLPASFGIDDTCADITHTATGGGVRKVTVDTIRAHVRNPGRNRRGSRGYNSQCRNLNGNTLSENMQSPQGFPAQAAPAPTEKISNLQVTEVDATSVSVTWDAVEHATSYDVSWSAESSDSLNASAGALPGVTGTTATIQHDALVPMTLTVTVTPEYIDENGVTEQLDALARTATLAVGPLGQRLDSGGGTNGGNGGSIDAGFGAVDLPVPVSHWRFEDDAVDWVGSSHGTEKGGVAFETNEEGEGVESYALSLDGTDDYVDLASHVSDFPLGDSTRSITGWFKADTGNQRQTFFTYGPNVEGKRFSIAADRTQVLVAVSGHAWGVNGLELKDGWHHVAVTYAGGDSDDISVYLDGELQSASTLAGSSKQLDTQTGPAAIGRSVSGMKYYTGLIDDVRLYDVALSAEHVLALFEEHPQTVLVEDNQEVCVSEELAADVDGYSKETWRESADHVERWLRVLETFSGTASDSRVMTPTEAEGYVNRGWPRWESVLEALECMEERDQ